MTRESSLPAKGITGMLLNGGLVFRMSNPDDPSEFVDFDVIHPDLMIKIVDDDAFFVKINGKNCLDCSI